MSRTVNDLVKSAYAIKKILDIKPGFPYADKPKSTVLVCMIVGTTEVDVVEHLVDCMHMIDIMQCSLTDIEFTQWMDVVKDMYVGTPDDVLSFTFIWRESPQGQEYWDNVSARLTSCVN